MSEALTALRTQASSLREMLSELEHADEMELQRNWERRVPASATVGSGAEISHWGLTEHFLLTWIKWFQVSRLYSVYFGHGPGSATMLPMIPGLPLPMFPGLPGSWNALHRRCQDIKERAGRDGDLPAILSAAWGFSAVHGPNQPSEDVDELFVELVESHERLRLLEVYLSFAHSSWLELHQQALARDRQLGLALEAARPEVRETVFEHLRFYRHATLDVSWLHGAWNPVPWDRPDALSAVRRPAVEPVPDEQWGGRLAGELELEAALSDHLRALLSRVQRAIWEIGFPCLAEDLTAQDFQPANASPVGTPSVQINPTPIRRSSLRRRQISESRRRERTHIVYFQRDEGPELPSIESDRLLLYVSKPGRGGWKQASRTLEVVAAYLAEVPRRPDLVAILLDAWDSTDFSARHRNNLRPYARSGVHFLFLLAGTSRQLSRLDVAF